MSLLTEFQAIQTKVSDANYWATIILNHEEAMENQNYWKCYYYNFSMSSSPSLSDIAGRSVYATQLRADTEKSQNWNWGNNYVGVRQCWVKCLYDYTLSTSFWTDDAGRICLNGVSITTSTSCTAKSCSLPFEKGWNLVQILFQEGSGGDGGYLTANLSSQSFVEKMYANKIGE